MRLRPTIRIAQRVFANFFSLWRRISLRIGNGNLYIVSNNCNDVSNLFYGSYLITVVVASIVA